MKKKEITYRVEARDYDCLLSLPNLQKRADEARQQATEEFMKVLMNASEPLQEVEWKEETYSDNFSVVYTVTISYVEWSREVTRVSNETEEIENEPKK